MDIALFKQHFPEFAEVDDGSILFWSGLAEGMVRREAWREMWLYGVELYTAHHLWLALADSQGKPQTGGGYIQGGAITAKSVDKVSVSFDVSQGAETNAGFWNETRYGRRFYRLLLLFGAGGRQL